MFVKPVIPFKFHNPYLKIMTVYLIPDRFVKQTLDGSLFL